jgi:hypothetical protein
MRDKDDTPRAIYYAEVEVVWSKRIRVAVPADAAVVGYDACGAAIDQVIKKTRPQDCEKHAFVRRTGAILPAYLRRKGMQGWESREDTEKRADQWVAEMDTREPEGCVLHQDRLDQQREQQTRETVLATIRGAMICQNPESKAWLAEVAALYEKGKT